MSSDLSTSTFPNTVGSSKSPLLTMRDVSLQYQNKDTRKSEYALFGLNLDVKEGEVLALVGPSGCGKSSILKIMNRMIDTVDSAIVNGEIRLDGEDIFDQNIDVVELRKRVGMVFQKANPFPKSIYENVAFGPKIHGMARDKKALDDIVEESLRQAALWDEVKDRLNAIGTNLSGGQQQRLCIARALAINPEIILMDEPTSALDPDSTSEVEDTIKSLVDQNRTIVLVTHDLNQAKQLSNEVGMMYKGVLDTLCSTNEFFNGSPTPLSQAFANGRPLRDVNTTYLTLRYPGMPKLIPSGVRKGVNTAPS